MTYLDYNATTPLTENVKEAINKSLELYFNPSSQYKDAKQVHKKIEEVRNSLAKYLNANSNQIIFTSCATESNNAVINSCINSDNKTRKHIIVSSVEHSAILKTVEYYKDNNKIDLTVIPVDECGRIKIEEIEKSINDDTVLVSVMLVNNEIGNIYPIKEISEIVHKKNKSTLMHTDATQAIGKMKVDVQDLGVDYLTMSGHKIYAPKGIGALYIKDSSRFTPFIHGGHQENNLRAGTENFISIVALGQAIQDIMEKEDYERDNERKLRDLLEEKIKKIMKGARILGDIDNRVCNTSCVLLDHMDGHIVCIKAEEIDGVYISAGSACNSDNVKPSHVMEAIGVNQIPIRVSIGRFTSENDILACVQTLMKIKKYF